MRCFYCGERKTSRSIFYKLDKDGHEICQSCMREGYTKSALEIIEHNKQVDKRKEDGKMINRETYCKDCDRSIYATGALRRSCDTNINDNGYYNLAGEKCYCKIVSGKRAEKYPWEPTQPTEKGGVE